MHSFLCFWHRNRIYAVSSYALRNTSSLSYLKNHYVKFLIPVFLRRLNNNYTTLVELNGSALNVLLNCMEDKKVLCLEDRKYITQPDCHNATLHHPVYNCHQLKAAWQVLPAYNRGWIQYFLAKKYLDIMKILRIMEENCLMHVLNCIISDESNILFWSLLKSSVDYLKWKHLRFMNGWLVLETHGAHISSLIIF